MQFAAPDTVTTTQWYLLPVSVIKWVVPRTSIATPVIPRYTRQNRKAIRARLHFGVVGCGSAVSGMPYQEVLGQSSAVEREQATPRLLG